MKLGGLCLSNDVISYQTLLNFRRNSCFDSPLCSVVGSHKFQQFISILTVISLTYNCRWQRSSFVSSQRNTYISVNNHRNTGMFDTFFSHHHHHHIGRMARTELTISLHSSVLSMALGRPASCTPVSSVSSFGYVLTGLR